MNHQDGDEEVGSGERDATILALLEHAGVRPQAAEAAIAIDAVLQHWRRRAQKRELGHRALKELNIPMDLAQLDVLVAIEGRESEFAVAKGEETMVQTVAERLNIDPSRASRIVSEMVAAGYAQRAASQADARRTIIALTDQGRSVVAAARAYKWLLLGDFLGEWTAQELMSFLELLQRFSEWQNDLERRSAKFETEIAQLAKDLVMENGRRKPPEG